MTETHRLAFIQPRLQARHGARPAERDWRMLRSRRSLGLYLDEAHSTSLGRFTARLHANMQPHTIERLLRAAWRDYVAELSTWLGVEWRPSILWLSHLPDLAVIDHLRRGGEAPAWLALDPRLAPLAISDATARERALRQEGLVPLSEGDAGTGASGRWRQHLARLWPTEERALLAALAVPLSALDDTAPRGTLPMEAQLAELARRLTLLFRRRAQTPLALFAHLGLVAIDLMRLRGDLLARRLFAEGSDA